MDNIAVTLKKLRVANGLSQIEVAERLSRMGVPSSNKAISRWEVGASQPTVPQFLSLCKLYGVSDPYTTFFGEHSTSNAQSIELSVLTNGLNALGWSRVSEYIAFLRSNTRFTASERNTRRTVRLYDVPASAGTGVFLDESEYTDIAVDDAVPEDVDYALRISGDSMEPTFDDEQIVYVRKQETLDIGDVGIFIHNNDVYCKELGRGELISHNSDYAPIPVSRYDAFYVLGKVIG
ncbi:MAG: helix-turn-helix domain-containing protein [Oscillospiraceae bacterium]|jgi:SOS-response transcriptional repressor LexA|nr:helix-turn-helix domain-containing protein [Oscillospiraceae bacterium]